MDVNGYIKSTEKTYLHLAVQHKAKHIVSYLLFDIKADPNKQTAVTKLGALHIAVYMQLFEIIELLLTCEKTNIDLMSPLHGTPLHQACKVGSVKVVQQLLLNNADFSTKNLKGRLPKEVTRNQRIIYLIEKYEKRYQRQSSFLSTSGASNEEKQMFETVIESSNKDRRLTYQP